MGWQHGLFVRIRTVKHNDTKMKIQFGTSVLFYLVRLVKNQKIKARSFKRR